MKSQALRPYRFLHSFRSQRQCVGFLFSKKYPSGYSCPRCRFGEHFTVEHRGGSWVCKACLYSESAKAGTLFHDSKVPLPKWFKAIYEMTVTKGGVSALELQFKLELGSYRTAWKMLHKLRHAMGLRDGMYKIGGVIEMDGAFFGSKKRGTLGKVYIAVESQGMRAGFAKAVVVDKLGREAAEAFINRSFRDGTTLRTDNAGGLEHIRPKTFVVPHRKTIWNPAQRSQLRKELADRHLRWVNTLIGNIKGALRGTYYGVNKRYLQLYLDEYIFRFNRRIYREELQTRLVNACVTSGPWKFNGCA